MTGNEWGVVFHAACACSRACALFSCVRRHDMHEQPARPFKTLQMCKSPLSNWESDQESVRDSCRQINSHMVLVSRRKEETGKRETHLTPGNTEEMAVQLVDIRPVTRFQVTVICHELYM